MRSVNIPLPDGISLEGRISVNPKATLPLTGIVIIHPYSVLGGSLNDFVIAEIARYGGRNGGSCNVYI